MKNNQYIRQAQYKQGFANIVLIAILVILIGVISYSSYVRKSEKMSETSLVDTSEWETYTNTEFDFSFKYSEEYILDASKINKSELINSYGSYRLVGYGNVYRPEGIITRGPISFSVSV